MAVPVGDSDLVRDAEAAVGGNGSDGDDEAAAAAVAVPGAVPGGSGGIAGARGSHAHGGEGVLLEAARGGVRQRAPQRGSGGGDGGVDGGGDVVAVGQCSGAYQSLRGLCVCKPAVQQQVLVVMS